MSTKRALLTILAASTMLLALGVGSQLAGAQTSAQQPPPPGARSEHSRGVTIPYPGRLHDNAGQPAPDGAYDFTFTLYDAETGGELLWSEVQEGVTVQGGAFVAALGSVTPIPAAALDGDIRWLTVAVRGPGETGFTALAPRQRVSAAAPPVPALSSVEGPDSPSAGLTCEHDHFGESWSGTSGGSGLSITNDGLGSAIFGKSQSFPAVYGFNTNDGAGVRGESDDGPGVSGLSTNGVGVYASSSTNHGVYGTSTDGDGVYGLSTSGIGVSAFSTSGSGVSAFSTYSSGVSASSISGVAVEAFSRGDDGVAAKTTAAGKSAVFAEATGPSANYGVYARSQSGDALYARTDDQSGHYAGKFVGNVQVTGNLSKGGGSFKIDHPLDPANKYLYHSFVESPDMKNVYDGVVVLDENGAAWVELPAWFEALNEDFRYQLTPIGAPGPNLYIAQEIQDNRFQIAGGTSGMKVSWQVTGIRHDPWATAHRIPVEEDKPPEEQGTYLHPVEHGQPETLGLDYQQSRQGADAGGEP